MRIEDRLKAREGGNTTDAMMDAASSPAGQAAGRRATGGRTVDAMMAGASGPAGEEAFNAATEPVTPEEQEAYEKVVLAGSEVLYNDKTHPKVMKMLQDGAEQPAQTVAKIATMIMGQIDDQSNGTIPEEVIIPAATEVAEDIAELAHESGAFQVDQALLDQVGQNVLLMIAEEYGVTEEEAMEFLNELQGGSNDPMGQNVPQGGAGGQIR